MPQSDTPKSPPKSDSPRSHETSSTNGKKPSQSQVFAKFVREYLNVFKPGKPDQ